MAILNPAVINSLTQHQYSDATTSPVEPYKCWPTSLRDDLLDDLLHALISSTAPQGLCFPSHGFADRSNPKATAPPRTKAASAAAMPANRELYPPGLDISTPDPAT